MVLKAICLRTGLTVSMNVLEFKPDNFRAVMHYSLTLSELLNIVCFFIDKELVSMVSTISNSSF